MNNEKHTDNILYTSHDEFLVESYYSMNLRQYIFWTATELKGHEKTFWQRSADITLAEERDKLDCQVRKQLFYFHKQYT